jgi:hypothetical protein
MVYENKDKIVRLCSNSNGNCSLIPNGLPQFVCVVQYKSEVTMVYKSSYYRGPSVVSTPCFKSKNSNIFDQVEKQCITNTRNIIHFDSRITKLEEKPVVQPVIQPVVELPQFVCVVQYKSEVTMVYKSSYYRGPSVVSTPCFKSKNIPKFYSIIDFEFMM